MSLQKPTPELVRKQSKLLFETDPEREQALNLLLKQYPENYDVTHVLLKVLCVNELYHTRMRSDQLIPLARHIVGLGIDRSLKRASSEVVHKIACCSQTKRYYSFATKYCSWHNQSTYPIWDRNVQNALCAYSEQQRSDKRESRVSTFADFKKKDLQDYDKFQEVISKFREEFGLEDVSLKEIDKFLWYVGDELRKTRS